MQSPSDVKLPPLTRVPGKIKQQKEYVLNKDLTKLSRRELLDLKSRQLKLLENKSWIKRLPDKGEKIQHLYDRIVEALEYRTDIDCASKLLSTLSIGSNNLNNLEWEGSMQPKRQQEPLDSDDDEQSPLEILASSNSVNQNQRIIKSSNDPSERPLITEQDIREAKEIEKAGYYMNPVNEKICQHEKLEPDYRFLPYKSTEMNKKSGSSESVKENKSPKVRDNSAATPPVTERGTVALTLRESIEVEYQQQVAMKDLLEKQAAERLAAKMKDLKAAGLEISVPPKIAPHSSASSMTKYRLVAPVVDLLDDDKSDEDKSDDSLTDDEEQED